MGHRRAAALDRDESRRAHGPHLLLALPQRQVFTSRGFAVVDVDYGGSTGYGREYRERLDGAWGVVDVDDCINAARYLAEQGLVDGRGWQSGAAARAATRRCVR